MRSIQRDCDVLRFERFLDAVGRAFPRKTARLATAEERRGIGSEPPVEHDHAALHLARQTQTPASDPSEPSFVGVRHGVRPAVEGHDWRHFAEMDAEVRPLLKLVDHRLLNDVEGLENPTAAVIVDWFFDRILGC
nr:6-carboxytetrahydropterin synthase [Bradyrhizobium australafricanum]